jgi:hypothetical protein
MRVRTIGLYVALGAVTVMGCEGEDMLDTRGAPLMSALQVDEAPCESPVFDTVPSLVYDDLERLQTRFALRDVLDTLLERAEVQHPTTSEALWGQWWRSNASLAPGEITDEPRCDVGTGADRNGFPIVCDRPEVLLQDMPIETHEPIQLVNRGDLMSLDGSHCGEYRIVYALRNQPLNHGQNLIIFEGVMPNPQPECGAAGCRPIVAFWAELSTMTDDDAAADALRDFFFTGLPEHDVVPVIRPEAYGVGASIATGYSGPTGQIRTNQFFHPDGTQSDWTLREYSLERSCTTVVQPTKPVLTTKKKKKKRKKKHQAQLSMAKSELPPPPVTITTCTLVVRPQPVANNPDPGLFNGSELQSPEFQAGRDAQGELISEDSFIAQLATMIHTEPDAFGNWPAETLADVAMSTAPKWDAAESIISGASFPYVATKSFATTIADELPEAGPYNASHIVARATMNSCGGCHQLSNSQTEFGNVDPDGEALEWPIKTLAFVHIDKNGVRSNLMNEHFLPHRFAVMQNYLDVTCDECLDEPLLRTTDGELVTTMDADSTKTSSKAGGASGPANATPQLAKDVIELGGSATLSGSRTH